MVNAGLSRHLPRIAVWCNHGYAVVVTDNRGSANRGVQFAAHLKVVTCVLLYITVTSVSHDSGAVWTH